MLRSCTLAAIVFTLATTVTPAQNLVVNGDFENGLVTPWVFYSSVFGDVEVEDGVFKAKIFAGSTNTQLYQAPLALEGGVEYELSFSAWNRQRATKLVQPAQLKGRLSDDRNGKTHFAPEGSMLVAVSRHGAPYDNFGLKKLAILHSSPEQFVFRFTANGDSDDARLRFAFSAEFGEYFYFIDNIVLRQVTCGNGALDADEQCDDGNTVSGDGCDETCLAECQVGYASIDPDTGALLLAGSGICTLEGPAQADPEVFIGSRSGLLAQLPVLANGPTFIVASVSDIAPLDQATHKVIVTCPGVGKEIDVSVGTSAQTFGASIGCTDAMLCSVTAECPAGEILSGTWSFDGNLGDVAGGVITDYTDTSYTVTLQGPAGLAGSTLEAQIRCAP